MKKVVAKTARAKEGVYLEGVLVEMIARCTIEEVVIPIDDNRNVAWTIGIGKVGIHVAVGAGTTCLGHCVDSEKLKCLNLML